MIGLDCFGSRTVAVFGLGRSGLSAARALLAGGAKVLAWDDDEARRAAAEAAGVPLRDLCREGFGDARTVVLSPGVPLTHPAPHEVVVRAAESGLEVIGDIELFARSRPTSKVVAVTGTNGKSTTTALIGHILAACGFEVEVGGNIGRPVLDMRRLNGGGVYVVELSSYQLDLTTSFVADVAVLLNLTADHLDRHGDMAAYAAAKRRIFAGQGCEQWAIVGVDDPASRALRDWLKGERCIRLLAISGEGPVDGGVYVADGILHDAMDGGAVARCDLRPLAALPGSHNGQNAAAAYAAARALGVEGGAIATALASFPGLAHRLERVRVADGVLFVNDSKATNPDAAARALACYRPVYWIAGGRAKAGGLDALEPYLDRVARAYLIGEAAPRFAALLEGKVPVTIAGTLAAAVAQAYDDARASQARDAVVLLSPACASFDQFRDFEARGEAFRAAVEALAEDGGNGAPVRAAGGGAR